MELGTTCVKITGNPNESGWTQAYDFFPEYTEKQIKRGHVFVVFSATKDNIDLESAKLGRECLQRFHEEYFGNLEKEPLNCLRDSVVKVYDEFIKYLSHLEISAASVIENKIYSTCIYGGKVMLLRNGYLVKILDSMDKNVISASGLAKDKDFLILSTNEFSRQISPTNLKSALEDGVEEAVETLAPTISADDTSGRIGALIIEFSTKLQKTLEELDSAAPMVQTEDQSIQNTQDPVQQKKASVVQRLKDLLPKKSLIVRSRLDNEVVSGSRKKGTLIVGLVLLVLLGISIVVGLQRKKESDYKNSYESDLSRAVELFEESQKIISLDSERARQMYVESRRISDDLVSRGVEDSELNALMENLKSSRGKVLGEFLVEPELYLDLSLLSDGFSGSSMTASDGIVYVLSKENDKVVSVNYDSKKSEMLLSGGEVKGASDIASYFGDVYLLKNDGIFKNDDGDLDQVVDDNLDEGYLYAFSSNLYYLNPGDGRIVRYTGVESGFSNGTDWLTDESADLSGVVSWAFDGSIWLLERDGNIRRFSLGNELTQNLQGVPFELDNGKYIYTDEELEAVYVLIPESKRIVVFDKEGKYQKYYESDVFSDAKSIVVIENNILVMSPQKLLKFRLN